MMETPQQNPTMMMGATGGMMGAGGATMMMGNPAGGMMMANFSYPMMMQPQQQPPQQQTAFGPGAFTEPYDFCKTQTAQAPNMMGQMGQTAGMMAPMAPMGQTAGMMGQMGQTAGMMGQMGQAPGMMAPFNVMRTPYGMNPAQGGMMMMGQQQAFVNPSEGQPATFTSAVTSTTKVKVNTKSRQRATPQYDRKVNQ